MMPDVHQKAAPVALDVFRQGMRRLAGGVVVVAAMDGDGGAIGLTATAVCSLTVEPPSLLTCINRSSSLGKALRPGLMFCVNLLGAHHEEIARIFGGMGAVAGPERFEYGRWEAGHTGVPVLGDAEAAFECKVSSLVAFGSHIIVIGECQSVQLPAESNGALVYRQGSFHPIE